MTPDYAMKLFLQGETQPLFLAITRFECPVQAAKFVAECISIALYENGPMEADALIRFLQR